MFAVYCALVTFIKGYNEVAKFLKEHTTQVDAYLMITLVIIVARVVDVLYVFVNKHLTFKYVHLSEVISYFSYLIISKQQGTFDLFIDSKAGYVLICFAILVGMLIYVEVVVIPCFRLDLNVKRERWKEEGTK